MKNIKLNVNQVRQGDVIMVRVDNTDAEPKQVEPGQRVILMHGEVTGHTHSLRLDTPTKKKPSVPVFDASAERYIQFAFGGNLSHEEHDTAGPDVLVAGKYELGIQVEAGPDNMLRQVAD